MVIPWLVVVLPTLMAVLVVFAPAPEAGKTLGLRWRIAVFCIGGLTSCLAYIQLKDETREKAELNETIESLKRVNPLRKQASELAKDLFEFYNERERYKDRFKPGQALSESETKAALRWYGQTVWLYHEQYERRVLTTLDEIHSATGMSVDGIRNDATQVKFALGIQDVASRLSALAASLP